MNASEFVLITGHSGAGKSTLFKLLTATEKATTGKVQVFENDLKTYNYKNIHLYLRKIGVIFQNFNLITEYTAGENIISPLTHMQMTKKELLSKTHEVCEIVSLPLNILNEFPLELSGGEQQKVALARAIIHKPELILADEPTGNLDKENSLKLLNVLLELRQFKVTTLMATHDESIISHTQNLRKIELKSGEIYGDEFL